MSSEEQIYARDKAALNYSKEFVWVPPNYSIENLQNDVDDAFCAGWASRGDWERERSKKLVEALEKLVDATETFLHTTEGKDDAVLRVNQPAFRYFVQTWSDTKEALASYTRDAGKGG